MYKEFFCERTLKIYTSQFKTVAITICNRGKDVKKCYMFKIMCTDSVSFMSNVMMRLNEKYNTLVSKTNIICKNIHIVTLLFSITSNDKQSLSNISNSGSLH